MIVLEINNLTGQKSPSKFLEKVLQTGQKFLRQKGMQKVSLAFVTSAKIKRLNFIYRGKNKPTDVLSFTLNEDGYLGEIIICLSVAKKQAESFNHSLKKELARLLVHGYLHLLGYDHEKENEAKIMESLEEKILAKKYD